MKSVKDQNLDERLKRANEARRAILEKFKARPADDDPEVVKRRQERAAVAAEREKREAIERVIRESTEAADRKAERDRRYAARKARQAGKR